jgi:hypothetical protein
MTNRSSDELFGLIKSLSRAEKRNFKLFTSRNTGSGDLKIVQLFDAFDKMEEYDEAAFLKKNKTLKTEQLPNLKAHLYRQILSSLRVLRDDNNIEIQLYEQQEHARILYNKGLFQQALKVLARIKEAARQYHQNTFWLQALIFEKKIESLHITRSNRDRAQSLTAEVNMLNQRILLTGNLSNLSLQLYSWYLHVGHARNAKDAEAVKEFFAVQLPPGADKADSFYPALYLYQSYCWYAFILQDFRLYYRYAQKWAELFVSEPQMRRVEAPYYIKSMHNVLLAHFMTRNYQKYREALERFENFGKSPEGLANDNVRVQTFIYLQTARLNGHFMFGTFREGLAVVPELEAGLEAFGTRIDRYRELVFYYKIASLYFGAGDENRAIDWLNRIIHQKTDLRSDIQCYARLLHLIAHYELGNLTLLEHLLKSVYRFMAKMENLGVVEEEIFRFLRKAFKLNSTAKLKQAFQLLYDKLVQVEQQPFERRSFIYLDVAAWLQSKIEGSSVETVIRRRVATPAS